MSNIFYLLIGWFIGLGLYRLVTNRLLIKPKKQAVIAPEDMNKEPTKLRNKMDKLYLKLDILEDPKLGLDPDVDHKKELMLNIDDYRANMEPFLAKVNNTLDMPKDKFSHVGYYFQGDMYDLDGKHLYESKRWVSDLESNFPWKEKKGLYALYNDVVNVFKRKS
jgi:hypothetical protein